MHSHFPFSGGMWSSCLPHGQGWGGLGFPLFCRQTGLVPRP